MISCVVKHCRFKPVKLALYNQKCDKIKKELGSKFDEDKFKVKDNQYLSAILQDAERQIITKVMKHCADLLKVKVTAYCYDGFQILKEGCPPDLVNKINNYVNSGTGWRQNREGGNQLPLFCKYCKFIVKDFQEPLNINNLLPLSATLKIENDKDATNKILAIYPHIKCCDDTLYVFDHKRGMWKPDDKFLTFKRILMSHADDLTVDMPEGSRAKPSSYGSDFTLMNKVCQLIKSATIDDTWLTRKERSGKFKLLFADGIYDMKLKQFTKGFDPEVVFFDSIPFNFPKRNEAIVNALHHSFFVKPFTQEQVASDMGYYLKQRLAKGIAGQYIKLPLRAGRKQCRKISNRFNGDGRAN